MQKPTKVMPTGATSDRGREPPLEEDDKDTIELGGRTYITQGGLARRLNVTIRTVSRWGERRQGPPKIKVGKLVLFDLEKLPGWLESFEAGPCRRRGSPARGVR